jgi:hypothetical protein
MERVSKSKTVKTIVISTTVATLSVAALVVSLVLVLKKKKRSSEEVQIPELWAGTLEFGVASGSTLSSIICIDHDENICIIGQTNGNLDGEIKTGLQDFFISKLDKTGNKIWTKLLGGVSKNTYASGLSIGPDGSMYAIGWTSASLPGNTVSGTSDYFVVKYDSNGTRIWVKQVGAAGKSTFGRFIRVGPSGSVYLFGHTDAPLNGNTLTGVRDGFVAKYDPQGNHVWTKLVGAPTATTNGICGAIDSQENAYLVGYVNGGLDGNSLTGTRDGFVTMYDTNGSKKWTRQQGVQGVLTRYTGVKEDKNGYIYVGGETQGGLAGNTLIGVLDLTITKYDSNGNILKTIQYGAPTVSMGFPQVEVDSSGNIILASYTNKSFDDQTIKGSQDMNTIKFDSTGKHIWTRLMGAVGGVGNTTSLVADKYNRVFVFGNTTAALEGKTLTGTLDCVILKYSPDGTLKN